jgi:hypothetical protein
MIDLAAIIENEWFIVCDLLPADQFIKFCRDRGIDTSREQLEQLERVGLFYPVARVRYPKVTVKIEYSEDRKTLRHLGVLEEGEAWGGETIEDYAAFYFNRQYNEDWLRNDWLWEPQSRKFEPWSSFLEEGDYRVESYYSMFQCFPLYRLCQDLTIRVGGEWWGTYDREEVEQTGQQMVELAKARIESIRKNGYPWAGIAIICQAISNRYYPKTQSDRRALSISQRWPYHDWRWEEYCRKWDAEAVRQLLDVSVEELKKLQERTALDACVIDPLEHWYSLIRFVSVDQRARLKGNSLLAQTLYAMEEMLRFFYQGLTGERLYAPDESPDWRPSDFYGEQVPENELLYLEFLTNQYHLNPRPRLLLFVEGDCERQEIPRIARELLGCPLERVGIQVEPLQGIGEARKLERLIDHYHYRQTIVYVIVDNEDNAKTWRDRLLRAKSKHPEISGMTITKSDYVFVWEKSFEFDNFSVDEIAAAMTKVAGKRYEFTAGEVAQARAKFGQQRDRLSDLYEQKLGYDLKKPRLAETLVQAMLDNPVGEFNAERMPKRPITAKIWEIIQLAAKNYQPIRLKDWQATQQGEFLRGAKEDISAPKDLRGKH